MPKEMQFPLILGIDYGTTNIGVAFGRNGLVSPLRIVQGKNTQHALDELARLAIEMGSKKFVVGLPLNAEGKETLQSLATRRFAKSLKVFSKSEVVFQNEYATTLEAMRAAIDQGTSQKKRKTNDHLSAAVILKKYYDEHPNT